MIIYNWHLRCKLVIQRLRCIICKQKIVVDEIPFRHKSLLMIQFASLSEVCQPRIEFPKKRLMFN